MSQLLFKPEYITWCTRPTLRSRITSAGVTDHWKGSTRFPVTICLPGGSRLSCRTSLSQLIISKSDDAKDVQVVEPEALRMVPEHELESGQVFLFHFLTGALLPLAEWKKRHRESVMFGVGRRRVTLALLLACSASWLLLGHLPPLLRADLPSDGCTAAASKAILRHLCADFAAGSATGNLCADLCVRGLVEYKRCLHYRSGKKVMEVHWRGRPVILKSKLENLSSYQPLGVLGYRQDTTEDTSPMDVLLSATMAVRSWLGLAEQQEEDDDNKGEEGASSLVNLRSADKSYSRGELTSLWSLLQQDEYTFLRVLQDLSAHVSKVLGSCGHFYAVESLSAGHAWDQNIFSLDQELAAGFGGPDRRGMWAVRHKVHRIALSFLDMVQHFERDFTHKVHLCDVKPENFAIRKDLTVVAIDVDMAFFQPKMEEILDHKCSGDDDCGFFDCMSLCDLGTRRCRRQRINTNLQVICQKIFRLWFSPTLLGAKAGLPLQVELQRAVQECSESGDADKRGRGAGRDAHGRLLNVLSRLLHEGGVPDK
ncbi:divergent protein kinase domain 1C isoform X1 [Syngnathus acus]|uniref:divergent protein kinase domain 1C isoform X1 n=2 Tax=Syngnathus acus TaxID=161584 RepID=UPI001885E100|nr:divergent protein kinase domain 1C isoform X1 [Syngnathus acus]